jgi:hypothetical protein
VGRDEVVGHGVVVHVPDEVADPAVGAAGSGPPNLQPGARGLEGARRLPVQLEVAVLPALPEVVVRLTAQSAGPKSPRGMMNTQWAGRQPRLHAPTAHQWHSFAVKQATAGRMHILPNLEVELGGHLLAVLRDHMLAKGANKLPPLGVVLGWVGVAFVVADRVVARGEPVRHERQLEDRAHANAGEHVDERVDVVEGVLAVGV